MQDDPSKVWLVQDCHLRELQECSSSALHFISGLDAPGRAVSVAPPNGLALGHDCCSHAPTVLRAAARSTQEWSADGVAVMSPLAMQSFPVTTQCYANRLAVLHVLLVETLAHRQDPECTAELADCFDHEARRLQASIWAMHAEVDQD
jgi:hypothetical protein